MRGGGRCRRSRHIVQGSDSLDNIRALLQTGPILTDVAGTPLHVTPAGCFLCWCFISVRRRLTEPCPVLAWIPAGLRGGGAAVCLQAEQLMMLLSYFFETCAPIPHPTNRSTVLGLSHDVVHNEHHGKEQIPQSSCSSWLPDSQN